MIRINPVKGGRYNWRHDRRQSERLVYMGAYRHNGDRRDWHQFAKVDAPDKVWCEVLDEDLHLFEDTPGE